MTESHSNRIVSRDAKEVQFIAEQDGPPEQDFKERVVPLLRSCKSVKRAYLARVAYGRSAPVVALCLRAAPQADRPRLLTQIAAVFAPLFSRDQHLDIIFLGETQEQDLSRVCHPFMDRA